MVLTSAAYLPKGGAHSAYRHEFMISGETRAPRALDPHTDGAH